MNDEGDARRPREGSLPEAKRQVRNELLLAGALLAALCGAALVPGMAGALPIVLLSVLVGSAALCPRLWRGRVLVPLGIGMALLGISMGARAVAFEPLQLSWPAVGLITVSAWMLSRVVEGRPTVTHGPDFTRSSQPSAIGAYESFAAALFDELTRSRRYDRPFALLVARYDTPLSPDAGQRNKVQAAIAAMTRCADKAFFGASEDEILLICPEARPAQLSSIASRFTEILAAAAPGPVRLGVAVFPQDSLSPDQLLATAQARAAAGIAPPVSPDKQSGYETPARLFGSR